MISVSVNTSDKCATEFESLFKFSGMDVPEADIAEYLAIMILSRVRRRFMKQENPDGSRWPTTAAARLRMSGGKTYAKGGKYAPGGKKTGGNILFSSGNMYHSIQLAKRGLGAFAIQSDVPYAKYYMNNKYTIIGTTDTEVDLFLKAALSRMI